MIHLPSYRRRLTAVLLASYASALILFRPGAPEDARAGLAAAEVSPGSMTEPLEVSVPLADPALTRIDPPPMPETIAEPAPLPEPVKVPAPPVVPVAPPKVPSALPRRAAEPPAVRPPVKGVVLAADKTEHFHDEFVSLTLRAETPEQLDLLKSTGPYAAWVEKNGKRVTTVGEKTTIPLAFDPAEGLFRAKWPVPWNAPDGEYRLRLEDSAWPQGLPAAETLTFKVLSRNFEALPPGYIVLTLEGQRSLDKIPGPDGVKSIDGFPAWAEFIGADALFIQGGESSGYDKKPDPDFPWMTASFKGVRAFGEVCHRRGLHLGVYVLSYMVGGPPEFAADDYSYGWNYDAKGLTHGLAMKKRRGISITDPKRPKDIAALLRKFQAMPEVDWLGLDYIRPAFGSCELVEDFVAEMPDVVTPPNFGAMSPEERMRWVCKGRFSTSDPAKRSEPKFVLSDQWFWYRAHRTAQAVRSVMANLEPTKPVWAFTLSWNKGWEHGQDPGMMRDAGVDMDAIMLYEADEKMFRGLVKHWGSYMKRDQLNLIVGDTIDWPLHQNTLDPSGPESFIDRTLRAVRGFHTDGKPVRGAFFHDVARALWGRKGPYKATEWMLAAGHAATEVRRLHGTLPYDMALEISSATAPGEALGGTLSFRGPPPSDPVTVQLFSAGDLRLSRTELRLEPGEHSASFEARWEPDPAVSGPRGNRTFVAFRAHREGKSADRPVIQSVYIQGRPESPKPAPAPEPPAVNGDESKEAPGQ